MSAPAPALEPAKLSLTIDPDSFIPYYEQIAAQIRALISSHRLEEGASFLSEGALARYLGISKMPVRQAFQKLRSEGLLVIGKGKRPIIGSGRMPWNFQQLHGFSEEMRRRGLVPAARTLRIGIIDDPPREIRQALKLGPGESVYKLERLRSVNGDPVASVTSYLPCKLFPGLERINLDNQSLYEIFERVFHRKLGWAEELIGATNATADDAAVLETTPGCALLIIKETTCDLQRIPVEYSVSLLRGDRYTASVISVRR